METVKRLEVTEVEIREGVSLEDVFGVEFFGYSVKLWFTSQASLWPTVKLLCVVLQWGVCGVIDLPKLWVYTKN